MHLPSSPVCILTRDFVAGMHQKSKDYCLLKGEIVGEELHISPRDFWIATHQQPRVVRATLAAYRWAKEGCKLLGDDAVKSRQDACFACAEWSGGKCNVCGCYKIKLRLPSETCPLGKWPPIDATPKA